MKFSIVTRSQKKIDSRYLQPEVSFGKLYSFLEFLKETIIYK